jgi:hypothetical protein
VAAGIASIFGNAGAVGAIGGALNSIADRKASESAGRQALAQTREQIAFEQAIRQRQAELLAQEQGRQQIYARGAGDAFAGSLGEFQGNFEQKIGDASSQIASYYKEFLNNKTAAYNAALASAPAATGATANRMAATDAQVGAESNLKADQAAAVQGFGRAMGDAGDVMGQNESLASLLQNLAGGSAKAAQGEIGAQAGQYIGQNISAGPPSSIGDLFVGLAGLGNQYFNKPGTTSGTDYSLLSPNGPSLPEMGGGTGVRQGRGGIGFAMPRGLGIS